jgi:hypothetical protein
MESQMTDVLVPTIMNEPMDFTVIATSPAMMEKAQRSLILWAARKIQAIKGEMAEIQEQLDIATTKKWNTAAWRRELAKHEAGYYIVPPFPLDIFAIRTKRNTPHQYESTGRHDNRDQPAQPLPVGIGRYVSEKPKLENYQDEVKQKDGTVKVITKYYASEYGDVEFPFKLAKVEVREAAERAISSGIFDRLGVLPARRSKRDPILCGEILYPNKTFYRWNRDPERVTFFVAWWLDTKTL